MSNGVPIYVCCLNRVGRTESGEKSIIQEATNIHSPGTMVIVAIGDLESSGDRAVTNRQLESHGYGPGCLFVRLMRSGRDEIRFSLQSTGNE